MSAICPDAGSIKLTELPEVIAGCADGPLGGTGED